MIASTRMYVLYMAVSHVYLHPQIPRCCKVQDKGLKPYVLKEKRTVTAQNPIFQKDTCTRSPESSSNEKK